MKLTSLAKKILSERYLWNRQGNLEQPEEMVLRVADAVAGAELNWSNREQADKYKEEFAQLMLRQDFLPNSPTLLNAGKPQGQLAACFVLPLLGGLSNFDTLKQAAIIHAFSGGVGFSFNRVAPVNWPIEVHDLSLGIKEYLGLLNYLSNMIKQGGVRPGANMATLAVDHPDILEFINCKNREGVLNNFNISIAITDDFMDKVSRDQVVQLKYRGIAGPELKARKIFQAIAQGAWENGEPGVIFIDQINAHNPTPDLGQIETTNPCGEQPLLPFESCTLGSINLVNMLGSYGIDWDKLAQVTKLAVRFLDNVVEANYFPLEEIAVLSRANRKIGLGVMGFAHFLQLLHIPYASEEAVTIAKDVMSFIQQQAGKASVELAKERGSFPNIERSIFKGQLRRNATCTTIAPTGTISTIAGVSSGIEPLFAHVYERYILNQKVIEFNPILTQWLENNYSQSEIKTIRDQLMQTGILAGTNLIKKVYQDIFATADQILPEAHLRIQAAFQTYCDNAVSKTINLPFNTTVKEVEQIIVRAHQLKCKGVTTYRMGSRKEEALKFIHMH